MSARDAVRVVFDLSNLMAWLAYRPHVTGLQRVAARIAAAACGQPDTAFVGRVAGAAPFLALARDKVARLADPGGAAEGVDYLRAAHHRQAFARFVPRALAPLRRHADGAAPFAFAEGDALVNLGDFWNFRDAVAVYRSHKRAAGLRFFQFVHDLVPLTHPHLVRPEVARRFARCFRDVVELADGLFVASDDVARQIEERAAAASARPRPIRVVPFGWDFPAAEDAGARRRADAVLARHGLARGGYVLHVGTIEPRKNHVLVVRALAALGRAPGARMPALVIVGWRGWGTSELKAALRESADLAGAVRVLNDADDETLAALYRGCRFTVLPSLAEGWGLPVQESLLFGKPCLAADLASIREIGRDLVSYFDPGDAGGFEALLARWLVDDSLVAERERRIAAFLAEARLPSWDDAARAVLAAARRPVP